MPNVSPFYDAEPYWPKKDAGSNDGGGGSGGSGVQLGALQFWPMCIWSASAPTTGDSIGNLGYEHCNNLTLSVGPNVVTHYCDPFLPDDLDEGAPTIASGVSIVWDLEANGLRGTDFRAAYAISVSGDETITAVRELEGFTVGGETLSFAMPELSEDEALYIWFYRSLG